MCENKDWYHEHLNKDWYDEFIKHLNKDEVPPCQDWYEDVLTDWKDQVLRYENIQKSGI